LLQKKRATSSSPPARLLGKGSRWAVDGAERLVEVPISELILQKKARELCRSEGKAWSLRDFENGVPGVTMLTVVADENKRREYLNRAKVMLKRNST
jgi:hypothetical protein